MTETNPQELRQGSGDWLQMRCGKVTASRLSDVMAYGKKGQPLKAREDYMAEIVAEQLTGDVAEHFVSKPMLWGIDNEQDARSAYEVSRETFVDEIGFVPHPTIEMAGASPDGLVGEDGLVEIKCPTTTTHIKTLIRGTADPQYMHQMQWQMACTRRTWCDFVSYDPRMPEPLRLFVARVDRDGEAITAAEEEVRKFLQEVTETIAWIYQASSATNNTHGGETHD